MSRSLSQRFKMTRLTQFAGDITDVALAWLKQYLKRIQIWQTSVFSADWYIRDSSRHRFTTTNQTNNTTVGLIMPEPTTTTAATAVTISAASLLPFVNGNALLGAVFGAALFATTKKDLKPLQRLSTMIIAVGLGTYLRQKLRCERSLPMMLLQA